MLYTLPLCIRYALTLKVLESFRRVRVRKLKGGWPPAARHTRLPLMGHGITTPLSLRTVPRRFPPCPGQARPNLAENYTDRHILPSTADTLPFSQIHITYIT